MTPKVAKILRPGDYRHMPWKNGGGLTVEIATYPPGAALETFDWRVSIASVVEDGPFSRFADIDRTLSVLTGNGLELFVAGDAPVTLTADSAPHSFAADAETRARLIDGPLTDFNVMTRRGRCRHSVSVIGEGDCEVPLLEGAWLVAYCQSGAAEAQTAGQNFAINAGETFLLRADHLLMAGFRASAEAKLLAAVITPG